MGSASIPEQTGFLLEMDHQFLTDKFAPEKWIPEAWEFAMEIQESVLIFQ